MAPSGRLALESALLLVMCLRPSESEGVKGLGQQSTLAAPFGPEGGFGGKGGASASVRFEAWQMRSENETVFTTNPKVAVGLPTRAQRSQ
jgi:hypothetical protein